MAITEPREAARTIPIIYLDHLSIKSRAHAHLGRPVPLHATADHQYCRIGCGRPAPIEINE